MTASHVHVLAIRLPEAAYRRLADAALLRPGAAAAHLDDRLLVAGAADPALHEAGRGAVLHRDEAGRTDQVGLAQPQLGQRLVVGLVAEAGPGQLGALEPLRHHAPHREAVAD